MSTCHLSDVAHLSPLVKNIPLNRSTFITEVNRYNQGITVFFCYFLKIFGRNVGTLMHLSTLLE